MDEPPMTLRELQGSPDPSVPQVPNSLYFEVDAGLLYQLGEQLVARPAIALAELIKNAYDADATNVEVLLQDVTKPHGTIVVSDNGTGMTIQDVERSWMRIATTEKSRKKTSGLYHRPLTGAKGIGRFASRRLANRLLLVSVANTSPRTKERISVDIDWEKFESGRSLAQVPVTYKRESVPNSVPSGVTLYLQNARDIWTAADVEDVRQDLLTLTPPFDETSAHEDEDDGKKKLKNSDPSDPGFSLELIAEEFPGLSGQLNESFLESAWAKLTGKVTETGLASYTLRVRGEDKEEVFSPSFDRDSQLTLIPGASFTIYNFVYRSGRITGFNVREASAYGRLYGGVRIYLDGFRVFPYGESSDDWLDLDKVRAGRNTTLPSLLTSEAKGVKRPLLSIPGNNQLFGAVYISQTAQPQLQLTINRERLIENDAFAQLFKFVQTGIYWLTIQYARRLAEERRLEQYATTPTVADSLVQLEDVVTKATNVDDSLKKDLLERIVSAKRLSIRREEEIISEVAMLRVLASAGTTVITFGHQLKAMVDALFNIHSDLAALRGDIPKIILTTFDRLLDELNEWRTTVEDQARQIGLLVGVEARERKRRLVLSSVVDSVIRPLHSYTKRYGITVTNSVPSGTRTPPMFEAELHAVLVNLYTNALKAVRASEAELDRRIQITAMKTASRLVIAMSDSGPGIEAARWETAFKPFYTTSQDDPILGVGTGLGLTVVRDILRPYGGIAHFVVPEDGWKTTIQIEIPWEV